MAKIDLKEAYFAVPISEPDKKYLRFRWEGQTYQFNCLPFGLSCASWVFTKRVATVLREIGVRLVIFTDDILIMAQSETMLRDHVKGIINLGFVINLPKSLLESRQSIDFLGFLVNSLSMELELPGEKIKNIRAEARKVLGAERLDVLGKMNAATKATAMPRFSTNNCRQTCNRHSTHQTKTTEPLCGCR